MSKMSGDESEVVFDQLEKKLSTKPTQRGGMVGGYGALPWGPTKNNGIRPAVDIGLGATMGGLEKGVELRDSEVPRLPPEKQIQREEEIQTPPHRELHRNEGHQPRGPRIWVGLGPVDLADQRRDTAGRNRPNNKWSPVAALEDTVSRMQRDLEELQTENRFLRTPRAPVPVPLVRQAALTTTKVPWFNGSSSWEQYQQVFDAIVLSNGWGDAIIVASTGRCLERGIISTDAPPSFQEGVDSRPVLTLWITG